MTDTRKSTYKALHISPMIPSFRMRETVLFFTEVLEFTAVMDTPGYSILAKDDLTVHILSAGSEIGEMEFYLEVSDVDRIWDIIRDKVKGIKFKAPFDREYGMREIHIEVPYTKTLLFIGAVKRLTT